MRATTCVVKRKAPVRWTLPKFVATATEIHGDRYDYTHVDWLPTTNTKTKLELACNKHGIFKQSIDGHIHQKQGCLDCSGKRQYTLERFLLSAVAIHSDRYDYSTVVWTQQTKSTTQVLIRCKLHDLIFNQTISSHINCSSGCPQCAGNIPVTEEVFISRSSTKHCGKYNYSSVDWSEVVNNKSKVSITCPLHGLFKQTIDKHMSHTGCPLCSRSARVTSTTFIERAKSVHGNRYDYQPTRFTTTKTTVDVRCRTHGIFCVTPEKHTLGRTGCPKCSVSKGESIISRWLEHNSIAFIPQHRFNDCRNPTTNRQLLFDFYLPDHNICIEFQGVQHYEPSDFSSVKIHSETQMERAVITLKTIQQRDRIKVEYCNNNQITLIIISYTQMKEIHLIMQQHLLCEYTP